MDSSQLRRAHIALAFAVLLGAVAALGGQRAIPARAVTMQNDFAGLVDIGGGRHLYLECHGTGSPTVIFESGYRTSGRYWTDDLLHPDAPRTMVLPAVVTFTHACAYDRPGTYAPVGDDILVSRSDPAPQPRTARDAVADLHALLSAAGIPGPYVLAGHSLGGFFIRLYASTYPDDVSGMVLVDAYSEQLQNLMTPDQWAALVQLNQQQGGTDSVVPIPDYGDAELFPFGGGNEMMRAAVAASPLRPMPLAVLGHGISFDVGELQGFAPGELERILLAVNKYQATLVPNGRFFLATESGHDIHQDEPVLVTEAVRQVVMGVRNPETWYELGACCAP